MYHIDHVKVDHVKESISVSFHDSLSDIKTGVTTVEGRKVLYVQLDRCLELVEAIDFNDYVKSMVDRNKASTFINILIGAINRKIEKGKYFNDTIYADHIMTHHQEMIESIIKYIKWCGEGTLPGIIVDIFDMCFTPDGYVYVIELEYGERPYKIGRAKNPDKRIDEFFTVKMPFDCKIIHTIPSSDYVSAERDLQQKYKLQRINGEWYRLSESDLEHIKGIKFYNNGSFYLDKEAE